MDEIGRIGRVVTHPDPLASPGWFPDPWSAAAFRWWDGTWWTAAIAACPIEFDPVEFNFDLASASAAAIQPRELGTEQLDHGQNAVAG